MTGIKNNALIQYVLRRNAFGNESGKRSRFFLAFSSLFFLVLSAAVLSACSAQIAPPAEPDRNITLRDNWQVQSAARVPEKGAIISSTGFTATGWFSSSMPATVMSVLTRNGVYKDPYFGKNLENIPTQPFQSAWWYRTTFDFSPDASAPTVQLDFEGINYRANIWLNGHKIANSDEAFGAFRTFSFDISRFVKKGVNALAVEIFPPQPGDFTIGFVDWNPTPPDRNMGIWREVKMRRSGYVSLESPIISSRIKTDTLDQAELTVAVQLANHRAETVRGTLIAELEGARLLQEFTLNPLETKKLVLNPDSHPRLRLAKPRLWWPNNMGAPELYTLTLTVRTDGKNSDGQNIRFGIREISDYINEAGHRGYKINGKKISIRGAGWVDDMFLADDDKKVESQFRYVRHMNLNCIRIEGFWGNNRKFCELADQYGILIMAGWSCQWEWEEYLGKPVDDFGGVKTSDDMELAVRSLHDQVVWLRNHPSVFVWVLASDRLPRPELEKKYRYMLRESDPSRPILASCKTLNSEVSGSTAVKMEGPYDYVPPVYWYVDSKRGGAYGFNTETGPGPQPPPLESIKRMIPKENLWPVDDMWNFHCGRNEFNTMSRYITALENRYWKPSSVEAFARVAQAANYEAMRAMFEAFAVNRRVATGVIQWMLNSAWPEMFWQLYDYYLMPNGAFYGAKTANRPVHIIYNYGDHSVCAVNDTLNQTSSLKAEIRLLDSLSKIRHQSETAIRLAPYSTSRLLSLPPLPSGSPLYFLDLRLKDSVNNEISRNFYWLSARGDVLDDNAATWFYTPQRQYADLSGLKDLPGVRINSQYQFSPDNTSSKDMKVLITLENPGDVIAFFIELRVAGKNTGSSVLPIFWDDNYISLLPGEQRTITARFNRDDLAGEQPVLMISGWNLE